MDIKKLDNLDGVNFPRRSYVAISEEAYQKLKYLRSLGKNIPSLIRGLLDEFFEANAEFFIDSDRNIHKENLEDS